MNIFRNTFRKLTHATPAPLPDDQTPVFTRTELHLTSAALERRVKFDVYLPPQYHYNTSRSYGLLLINDGQDMEAVQLIPTLQQLYNENFIHPLIVVAIHANEQRTREYGTAAKLDYKGRGGKAAEHMWFVVNELLPYLRTQYRCKNTPETTGYAGFSLGGLSAFDVAWANPDIFGSIGVFSGALWWRHKPYTHADPDGHRILHETIAENSRRDKMRFWFEAGTMDETCDRNNNGIIDAIDDTLDLIAILKEKGYEMDTDIRYVEIEDGRHDQETWAQALPDFLIWAFRK